MRIAAACAVLVAAFAGALLIGRGGGEEKAEAPVQSSSTGTSSTGTSQTSTSTPSTGSTGSTGTTGGGGGGGGGSPQVRPPG